MSGLSYSKWDKLERDLLEEEDEDDKKDAERERAENGLRTYNARGALNHPIVEHLTKDTNPEHKLEEGEMERLITWVVYEYDPRGDDPTHLARAGALIEHYEGARPPLRVSTLAELASTITKRLEGRVKDRRHGYELRCQPAHPDSKQARDIERLFVSALNTLCACKRHGGARGRNK